MSQDAAAPTPVPPVAEPRAGAAPAKHLRPSLFAALAAPVRKLWPRETDLGRIGMAIAAPVLCWVFYTTSSGMVDIMQKEPGDWVGLVGTVVATTAILVMLASTSWSLGADLAALIALRRMARERMVMKTIDHRGGLRLRLLDLRLFLLHLLLQQYLQTLARSKIVAELQPMELAADVVLPATKEIAARYDETSAQDRGDARPSKPISIALDGADRHGAHGRPRRCARRSARARRRSRRRSGQAARRGGRRTRRGAGGEPPIRRGQRADRGNLERSAADLDAIIKAKQDEIAALDDRPRSRRSSSPSTPTKGLDGLGARLRAQLPVASRQGEEANRRVATIRETLAGADRRARQRPAQARRARRAGDRLEAEGRQSPPPRRRRVRCRRAKPRSISTPCCASSRALRDQIAGRPELARRARGQAACASRSLPPRASPTPCPSAFRAISPASRIGARRATVLAARDEMIAARAAFDKKCCARRRHCATKSARSSNHIREASGLRSDRRRPMASTRRRNLSTPASSRARPAGLSPRPTCATLLKKATTFCAPTPPSATSSNWRARRSGASRPTRRWRSASPWRRTPLSSS